MHKIVIGRNETTGGPAARARLPILGGVAAIVAFFGGLAAWSALAPLESAAVAIGTVSVENSHKIIKHLEGGVVEKILVRDDERVAAGQVLIRLNSTQSTARLVLVETRLVTARARKARLLAERDGIERIVFADSLSVDKSDRRVREIIDGQVVLFRARRAMLESQAGILKQRASQLDEEIKGLRHLVAAKDERIMILRQEVEIYRPLVAKGLTPKPRLLELRRAVADTKGSRANDLAGIARTKQKIGEALLQIADLRTARINEVVEQLREVQAEIFDLQEQIMAARDVVERTTIKAPMGGTVVGLLAHTPGGVVRPGEPLMSIVPSGDRLIVEARIEPQDIDVVRPGLPARVRLTSFSSRHVTPIEGNVISVSADLLTDERGEISYYLARIELPRDLSGALAGAKLHPGMPAEVMIVTGRRTAMDYLLEPVIRTFDQAFRES
jgi:HlyD family secretion protein/epimerase transport system membrane fusion protein